MKLNEGIHLVKLPNGSVELCAGLETMFCFPQCSEKEFQLLQRLVAGCTRPDLSDFAKACRIPLTRVSEILRALVDVELLQLRSPRLHGGPDDGFWSRAGGAKMRRAYRNRQELSVSLNRADRMAQLLALELGAAGIGKIQVPATTRSPEPDLETALDTRHTTKDLVEQRLRHAAVTTRRIPADLAVQFSWGIPDPVAAQKAMQANQPFLAVVAGHDFVEVGPLVVPGLTPCTSCIALHQSTEVTNLAERAAHLHWVKFPRVETALAGAGAALAAAQALAFLDCRALHPGDVMRISVDGIVTTRHFEAHPECDCSYLPVELDVPPEPAFAKRARAVTAA
ncbi:hypothetical protein [uncultured Mobiluncus sp.]|uniref:hypothetical protein n=1 Tax=uncultured Mobiluncus sp. TaxID=293425 RepID=UPI0027D9876A|nr:hypothetical protein [uncultured Mobiluncus sp.]